MNKCGATHYCSLENSSRRWRNASEGAMATMWKEFLNKHFVSGDSRNASSALSPQRE